MNTDELFNLLHKRCKGMLLGVFARDELPNKLPPKRPLLVICNTDPKSKPGRHWIAMYFGKNCYGEYFDSFGQEPLPSFENYLNKFCCNWKQSDKCLQSVLSSFCGHYCVFFCLFKYLGYNMNSILNCFSNDTTLNDVIVHNFVCHNL